MSGQHIALPRLKYVHFIFAMVMICAGDAGLFRIPRNRYAWRDRAGRGATIVELAPRRNRKSNPRFSAILELGTGDFSECPDKRPRIYRRTFSRESKYSLSSISPSDSRTDSVCPSVFERRNRSFSKGAMERGFTTILPVYTHFGSNESAVEFAELSGHSSFSFASHFFF